MFLYLSKKISMPNGLRVSSLSWNSEQGWLACGGETGLLKVLKLEPKASNDNKKSPLIATPSNLSMNQTLDGHRGAVLAVSWNQNYRKLTSSDEKGLIIVWVLHKGMWFEEMVNNREKSVVRDLRWSSDGQKICIAYEDGHVVLGNVHGNRLWGKILEMQLCFCEWSPDCRLILLCTVQGTCQIHDMKGYFVAQLSMCFLDKGFAPTPVIVGIDWYNGLDGHADQNAPTLALALQHGKIQLMRHEMDEDPILLDLQMVITCIKWSPDGEVLAVVGSDVSSNTKVPSSMVQLYSHTGIHLRTLRVPGTKTSAVSWEGGGLRLALAVDSYIYLANIRPEYKWAFFGSSTCVYGFRKKDHVDQSVMFWDIGTGERYCKSVIHLIAVCAAGDYSILATLGDGPEKYTLIMCNAIGSPVDSRHIKTQPLYLAMNSHHVYIWNYCSRSSSPSSERADVKSELNFGAFEEGTFHIDDFLCQKPCKRVNVEEPVSVSMDKICCMCCSEEILIVGRESGILHQYDVEELRLEAKELIQCRPQTVELNCDSTRLSVIDMSGMLYFYDLKKQPQKYEEKHQGDSNISYGIRVPNFERKDVWNMKWADDNPNLLAVMEKGRMYILRGTEPEEPVACSAYLCSFHDLQSFVVPRNGFNLLEKVDGCIHLLHPIRLRRWIQAIQLDEMMCQPEDPSISHVFNHETKSLRDTQEMVSAVDMQDAYCYVEEHSHPRLWTSLANHALHTLDLSYAEKAFVKCKNYYGIQFVKGLHIFKNKLKQKAEICVYFKKDKEAEQIYNNMDRQDLILDMRMKLGDWIVLEKLLEGESGNDALLELTWNNIGDYHADRQSWDKAAVYYSKAKKCEKLAECFYALGDWDSLGEMVTTLHKDSPLLPTLAKKFLHAGICKHAVTAFVESGDIKAAIDCCMDLNNWDLAIDLAKKHDFLKYVQNNIAKCTKYLVQIGNPLHAAQIHCKANQPLDAAKIFLQLAEQMAKIKTAPIVVKKLYVLSAIQADACRASFDIKQDDATTCLDRLLKNAWHGAEAYHFWLLSHRHLYAGRYEQSMQVAWWLQDYEDILDDLNIYSLIALTSFLNKNYAQCSKAVKKLESLSQAKENLKKTYAQLAFSMFTRSAPTASSKRITRFCTDCGAPVQDSQTKCSTPTCKVLFRICMATGNLIVDEIALQCPVCKHHLIVSKLEPRKYCPLCHTSLEEFTTKRDIY